jgi:hypothetical protein
LHVGLCKIANDENVNYHYNREDRLLDELGAAQYKLEDAEASRTPEVVQKAQDAFIKRTLIGGVIGAGIGGIAGAASGGRLGGTAAGMLLGGGVGLIPGSIAGELKHLEITQAEEDPTILQNIADASSDYDRVKARLERHHLIRQHILNEEERRLQDRRELFGY